MKKLLIGIAIGVMLVFVLNEINYVFENQNMLYGYDTKKDVRIGNEEVIATLTSAGDIIIEE